MHHESYFGQKRGRVLTLVPDVEPNRSCRGRVGLLGDWLRKAATVADKRGSGAWIRFGAVSVWVENPAEPEGRIGQKGSMARLLEGSKR